MSNMTTFRPTVRGHKHMIAAGHYLATQAGYAVLEGGGNAVDAGVAAAMVLGVAQSDLVSVTGVAPIMVRFPDSGAVTTISGVGRWPRAARIDDFVEKHGGHIPRGVLRTVVPAAPDAFITALDRWGTMSFAEAAAAAIRVARDGFVMYDLMAESIAKDEAHYAEWASTSAIYLPGGRPPAVGDVFRHTDLARMLQHMCDEEKAQASKGRSAGLAAARRAFYEGDIARAVVRFHEQEGGLMTMADMADFHVGIEPAVSTRFRDTTVHACGMWCQGPVLVQLLNILDGFDLEALGHNSPAYLHVLAEATKLAFGDRERYYGDPEFTQVPVDWLISKAHADEQRALIREDRALDGRAFWQGGGMAGDGPVDGPGSALDTSYVCAVDSTGLTFSCTPSDGASGSPVIPGLGAPMSSRGSQNWAIPGHPSALAPWKRPRLTPNPAIAVSDDGKVIPFGTPGADVQAQAMVQALVNLRVFGMTPQEAVEAPRAALYGYPQSFEPHESGADVLRVESRVPAETRGALADRGHTIENWPDLVWKAGAVCLIEADSRTGTLGGAADPRRPCAAMGF